MLLEVAHNAGVITNEEYAEFQNAGYMGLYGGLTVDDIHKRKNLKDNEKIFDFMGSTELIANLFRISQNWIGGSMPSTVVYVPPPHTEVAECLTDFEKFINNEEIDTPDLIKIAILHYWI